jgi:hypothetical protein
VEHALHKEGCTWNNIIQPLVILFEDKVVALQEMNTLPAPEEVVDATPPPGNSVVDMVSPNTATPPSKTSQRTTRKRGILLATPTKEGHDNDVEVTATKPPTKRVRGFKKR